MKRKAKYTATKTLILMRMKSLSKNFRLIDQVEIPYTRAEFKDLITWLKENPGTHSYGCRLHNVLDNYFLAGVNASKSPVSELISRGHQYLLNDQKWYGMIFLQPRERLSLYLNEEDSVTKGIALWRLRKRK